MLCGQEAINQTDESGLRQGLWEKYYTTGKLIYRGYFRDGIPVGNWKRYHENGNLQAVILYAETPDSAFVTLYDPDGKRVAEGAYLHEKRTGSWNFFSGNRRISEEEYVNGVKHGLSKTYYPTGELFEKSEWANGLRDGKYSAFYKTGIPYLECFYAANERHGVCKSYDPNGNPELVAFYKQGKRHGDWKYYSAGGDLLYTVSYKNGKLLNPSVLDSIQNQQLQEMDRNKGILSDPEEFLNNPAEYMQLMNR
jgi:antitoxin component YwqK of YwqJK toxin-antitoxin module